MTEHWTLTVYEGDDVTVAWEVGTDPTHAAPYLHRPEGGEGGSVDLVHGGASIGQHNLRIIDPQSGATQAVRWLTARLSGPTGHSAVIRHRAVLRRGSVVVMDGVLSRVELSRSFAGFAVELRDIRERARKVKVFDKTPGGSPTSVFPRGVANGYGALPGGGFLVQPTVPVRATANVSTDALLGGAWKVEFDLGLVSGPSDRPTVAPGMVFTDSMREAIEPERVNDNAPSVANRVQVWWRPIGGDWNILTDSKSTNVWIPVLTWWPAKVRTGSGELVDVQTVRSVQHVRLLESDPYPTDQQEVEVMVVYVGEPTEANPWHWEGEWGEFVRNLARGDYSKRDPRLRIDEGETLAIRTRIRLRITKVEDDLRTVLEELHKGVGAAPALDGEGRLSPIRYELPPLTATLPALTNAEARPVPGWEHPSSNIISAVEVTYHRDIFVPASDDPTGERSAGDGIRSRPVTVRHTAPEAVLDIVGEETLTIDGWMFRALGDAQGHPVGEFRDEYGAQAADALKARALDRFVFGGQTSLCLVPEVWVDSEEITFGSWVLDRRTWRPDYQSGERGGNIMAQVVAMNLIDEAWVEIELVDAAPEDQPLLAPTIGAPEFVTDPGTWQGTVKVEVTTSPGGIVDVEYAIVATGTAEPAEGDPAWTFAQRVEGLGDAHTAAVPGGRRVWVRARSVGLGRRPSAWTAGQFVEVPAVPVVREVASRLSDDGVVILVVTANSATAGIRVHFAIHTPDEDPGALGSSEDFAYPLPEGTTLTGVTVPPGMAITLEHVPYPTFGGGSVSGTPGAGVRETLVRATDRDLTPIDVRPIRRTESHTTYRVTRVQSAVAEVWLYQALAVQDTLDPWPDEETDTPQILTETSDGVWLFTVTNPPGGSERYIILRARDASLNPLSPAWEIKLGPLDPEPPVVETATKVGGLVTTYWWRVQERGIAVTNVEVQSFIGSRSSGWASPTRSAGGASVVQGGTLGVGEYEHDVTLARARLVVVFVRLTLETGESVTIPLSADRNSRPAFVSLTVAGTVIRVVGDDNTASVLIEHLDGDWYYLADGAEHEVDVSEPDEASTPGIAAGIWPMRVWVLADPVEDTTLDTLSDTRDVEVQVSSSDHPLWEIVAAAVPAPGSAVATITLDADPNGQTLGDYEASLHESLNEGPGWSEFIPVSASLTPALSAPPGSSTAYDRTTAHSRFDGQLTGQEALVRYRWRAEIREAASGELVATQTTPERSWYTEDVPL